jgi:hypothetical protein
MDLQHSDFRPGIGQEILGRQSFRLGRFVQGGDARAAGDIDDQDERPLRINRLVRACLSGEKTPDWPVRQPD